MDVLHFLLERTRLIRSYYDRTAEPLSETLRKIRAGEEPFVPPYSEDPEPAFMEDWTDATEMIEITGRFCISMLSSALQLYFKTWERELGLQCGATQKAAFKSGFIQGYRCCLTEQLGIAWDACPADLDIIEQVVLARNRDQHPESIIDFGISHSARDLERFPKPFFLSELESGILAEEGGFSPFMPPGVRISSEQLAEAIKQVRVLCQWLEPKLFDAKYP
jgi:hypothetical protein